MEDEKDEHNLDQIIEEMISKVIDNMTLSRDQALILLHRNNWDVEEI